MHAFYLLRDTCTNGEGIKNSIIKQLPSGPILMGIISLFLDAFGCPLLGTEVYQVEEGT